MAHDDIHPNVPGGDLSDALRWQLRGLRRDIEPARDLWPAIAGRIAALPQATTTSPATLPRPPAWRRFAPLAMAASMVFAIGLAWQMRPAPGPGPDARLLAAEADALTREYHAALLELDGALPAPKARELEVLDRSAAQIRTALRRDPDARFLLDRLQRTYERRLELTQRLAHPSLTS